MADCLEVGTWDKVCIRQEHLGRSLLQGSLDIQGVRGDMGERVGLRGEGSSLQRLPLVVGDMGERVGLRGAESSLQHLPLVVGDMGERVGLRGAESSLQHLPLVEWDILGQDW